MNLFNLFNLKSLSFYGATLAFVVALFSFTTNYGESNLRAPTKIAGRYRLSGKNLPGCLKAETLILSIEQSGIYLNGALLSEKDASQTATAAKKKPLLTGLFQQPQLELSGKPSLDNCKGERSLTNLQIQGTIDQATLKGKILLASGNINFTAKREDIKLEAKEK